MKTDPEGYTREQYLLNDELSKTEPLFTVGDRVRTSQGDEVEIVDVFGEGSGELPFAYKVVVDGQRR